MGRTTFLLFLVLAQASLILCVPVSEGVLVATATDSTPTTNGDKEDPTDVGTEPTITEMHITSEVANRFAKTVVMSKVKNPSKEAKETTFWAVLPEEAYIAGFTMEIAGKNYTAYVEEKDKAKDTYDKAVASGQGAAHVAVNARDSNKFEVSMNVEPESKATFYLTYEELLKRNDEQYELVININPKQIVKDMTVEVMIDESRKLTKVETPQIRTGNEIIKESEDLNPSATIHRPADNQAVVVFKPNAEKQKQIAHGLGKDKKEGINGQFVVVYDVERDATGGEVLVKDGYFVHFFAPAEEKPLNKHVVFVLDTSGSMWGTKIRQLREAMTKILGDAQPGDFFNVVEFNTNVKVHNLDAPSESTTFPDDEDNSYYNQQKVYSLDGVSFPPAYPVNENTKTKANDLVKEMQAVGGTNIYQALRVGLHLLYLRSRRIHDEKVQPIVFFLTDGDPTVGITNQNEIMDKISEQNIAKVPIISLSFGQGADRTFLEKISLRNFGFARHIYEDSDATIQLANFYKEVSSPLLRNINFKYVDDATSITKTEYPIYFKGSEFVVAGKIKDDKFYDVPRVECIGIAGPVVLNTTVTRSVSQLERMWAYMSVKKILDEKKIDETKAKEHDAKAVELAKKYSFVTPVTSLVVVKPNSTSAVSTTKADGSQGGGFFGGGFPMYASINHAAPQYSAGIAGPPPYPLSTPYAVHASYRPAAALPNFGNFYRFGAVAGYGGAGVGTGGFSGGFAGSPDSTSVNRLVSSLDSDIHFDMEAMMSMLPTTPTPVTLPDEYKPYLEWISSFLKPDGTLKFFKGSYSLGFNATSPANQPCTTQDSKDGQCKLVKDCPKLHDQLKDELSFKNNFCSINQEYAGVCCI